jgi:hypothetical protein
MSDREMKKVTVRIYLDDFNTLKTAYPGGGYNQIVRGLVARHVRRLRSITADKLSDSATAERLTDEDLRV